MFMIPASKKKNHSLPNLMKQPYSTLSNGVRRRFLLIEIREEGHSSNFVPEEIRSRLSGAFECRSIVIARELEPNENEKNGYKYLIGLHTENASKHNFRKRIQDLFPEIARENVHPSAKKGK